MKAVAEPLEGNKVKLSVEVDEAEFDKAVDAAFRRLAREVRIDGFRPGKAPRRVLEAKLGSGVAREEALREALPGYYEHALRETDTDAIAQPEIDITPADDGPLQFDGHCRGASGHHGSGLRLAQGHRAEPVAVR